MANRRPKRIAKARANRPRVAGEFADYLNAIDEPEEPNRAAIDRIAGAAFRSKPLCRVLIAEAGGRTAGYLVHFIGLDMDLVLPAAYVVDLFVREAHRKQGAAADH